MKFKHIVFALLFILALNSCRKDFDTLPSHGDLSFSKDTVFFNRVFDNISSSTHRFTVKNNSNDDISIPTIALERGNNSFYRLNVDGLDGKSFNDITVLAKDSIFVFAEVTANFSQITDPNFMYRDKVLFDVGANSQNVELEALVLDVNLIRPSRTALTEGGFSYEDILLEENEPGPDDDATIRGTNLTDDTVWDNTKPYLIYNFVGVPTGKTLTIEAGTQLFFHQNSGIIVQEGGKLIVNGLPSITEEFENQVVFQSDRLEENYAEIPGQWGTIWLHEGSEYSSINHATIKNATLGLLVDSNSDTVGETLQLNNTQIYNTTSYGMLGRNAKITSKNVVIANNGSASFASILGGNYNFFHTTLANYWQGSSRQDPTLLLGNSVETSTAIYVANLEANFTNCIIYGSQNIEVALAKEEVAGVDFNYNFKNCLMKFDDTQNDFIDNPLYDFENTTLFENVLLNASPIFFNTNASVDKINFIIGDDSAANNQGDNSVLTDAFLQKDILGVDRMPATIDLGAYQHITFP
ncbi:MAG: hypothetical protein V3U80_08990 [Flavobacteriaceae bacterium]